MGKLIETAEHKVGIFKVDIIQDKWDLDGVMHDVNHEIKKQFVAVTHAHGTRMNVGIPLEPVAGDHDIGDLYTVSGVKDGQLYNMQEGTMTIRLDDRYDMFGSFNGRFKVGDTIYDVKGHEFRVDKVLDK